MAYCTNPELTLLTGTTLSTSIQDIIIDQSDRKIKGQLRREGLTPPASDDDLKAASLDLSHARIVRWNQTNGIQTKSVKVGDITIQDDPEAAIILLIDSAWESVDAYVATQLSASPLPTLAVVGRSGQRIGEHEEMTEAEEDVY